MATVDEAAAHLGLGLRTLQKHLGAGVITRQPMGTYDLDQVRREYIVHMRRLGEERAASASDVNRQFQATRKDEAIADKYALDNEHRRSQLLLRAEVTEGMATTFGRVRSVVGELPAAIIPRLAGLKDASAIQEVISEEVNDVLDRLSRSVVVGKAG